MALAASMGLPPPMATIQSGWNCRMASAPFMTVSTEGSGSTPSNRDTSMPAAFRLASTLSRKPKRFMLPPPTTTMARLPSRSFSASRAPLPWYRSLGNVNLAIIEASVHKFNVAQLPERIVNHLTIFLRIVYQAAIKLSIV